MSQFAESEAPHHQTSRFAEGSDPGRSMPGDVGSQIEHAADGVVSTIKEYPMTTLAVAAGFAFAVGALWKVGRPRPSRWESLQSRLPELPTARQVKSYWR